MTDDPFREFARLQRQADRLRRLVEESQTKAPHRSAGDDSSSAVRVTVGRDGLPVSIEIAGDWQRRLAPAALAAAVQEAFRSAAENRMAVWTRTLEAGDWQARAERVMADDHRPAQWSTPAEEVPALFRAAPPPQLPPSLLPPSRPPRDVDLLAEEMMRLFGSIDQIAADDPAIAQATGESDGREVTVTVSRGGDLLGCTIDAAWATSTDHGRLNRAMDQALSSALGRLAAAATTATARAGTGTDGSGSGNVLFDSLFSEVMSLLQQPQRLSNGE